MVVAKAQITLYLARCSSAKWDQYAGALLWCRTHFPAHQHCRHQEGGFCKAAKKAPVYCLVHSVALCNILLMKCPIIEEDFQHHLALWCVRMESLFIEWCQELPVHWLSFSLWVVKLNPCFVACDYSVPQPRHFHDLALSDYYHFLRLKEQKGWWFASSDDLRHLQWQCRMGSQWTPCRIASKSGTTAGKGA